MLIRDMHWMQVEAYLQDDDRCVLPLGSVEQHGSSSPGVDQILAERVAQEAAEPLVVPVFPALPAAARSLRTWYRLATRYASSTPTDPTSPRCDATDDASRVPSRRSAWPSTRGARAAPAASWVTGQVVSVDGGT